MNRADRRDAVSVHFITELEAAFAGLPKSVRVVILTGSGGTLDLIQYGGRSVVSAMFGPALEIAAATNARISEPSTVIQLPEGRRGIFGGGGATVRVGRILGADRMTEMMLTARK